MFQYKNFEFPFDPSSHADMAKYEDACRKLEKIRKSLNASKSASTVLQKTVDALDDFINSIFGNGASEPLFADSDSAAERVEFVNSLKLFIQQSWDDTFRLIDKFMPKK